MCFMKRSSVCVVTSGAANLGIRGRNAPKNFDPNRGPLLVMVTTIRQQKMLRMRVALHGIRKGLVREARPDLERDHMWSGMAMLIFNAFIVRVVLRVLSVFILSVFICRVAALIAAVDVIAIINGPTTSRVKAHFNM